MLLSFRPVNCCPAHFGFVYPPSRQLAEGERLVFSLLKSVGSENRQERKITEERGRGGDGGKKALVLDSRLSRSRYLSETNGRNCERAENEKGESCGNCLSLPQSGIALKTISSSCCPSSSLQESLSTRVSNFICGGGVDSGGGGSRKFSMAKSSIIAVSSSISCSLSLWCQCGDEPKECSTLCGAPISSIKSDGGWHSNSSERTKAGGRAGNTCE